MAKYTEAPTVAAGLIRMARHKAGITQAELGLAAGVGQQVVSAYETGRREPTLPTLSKILAAGGYEMRIQLSPLEDHDESLSKYLEDLPSDVQAEIERGARERVEAARLRRLRGK